MTKRKPVVSKARYVLMERTEPNAALSPVKGTDRQHDLTLTLSTALLRLAARRWFWNEVQVCKLSAHKDGRGFTAHRRTNRHFTFAAEVRLVEAQEGWL